MPSARNYFNVFDFHNAVRAYSQVAKIFYTAEDFSKIEKDLVMYYKTSLSSQSDWYDKYKQMTENGFNATSNAKLNESIQRLSSGSSDPNYQDSEIINQLDQLMKMLEKECSDTPENVIQKLSNIKLESESTRAGLILYYMELVRLMNEANSHLDENRKEINGGKESKLSEGVVIKTMLDNHGFGLEKAKSSLAKKNVFSMTLEDSLVLIIKEQKEDLVEEEYMDDEDVPLDPARSSRGSRLMSTAKTLYRSSEKHRYKVVFLKDQILAQKFN